MRKSPALKTGSTSVGCGHASCGSKCSVGGGQKAAFLKRSASADRPVGRGQAAKSDVKDERSEVQHERQEMKLVKKLERMHPPSKLRVGTGQAAPAVGTGAGHHVRGQGRKAPPSSPRIGIPERPMLPPRVPTKPPLPVGGRGGDPPRTNVPAGRPSIQPMLPTPAPTPGVRGGGVFGGTAGGGSSPFAAPGVGAPKTNMPSVPAGPPPKSAPMGGGSVAPPSGGLKTNMPSMSADTPPKGPSPAGLGVKPQPGMGQARKRVGTGQRPVIPGIQQQRGAPAPVSFGEPAAPPWTQGSPRSTRQGPFNVQGQGPPMQKGKVGAGRPKKQGATVHPPKGRATKKMTP